MGTRFRTIAGAVAIVLSLLLAGPAAAIQYGEPDNGAHPYVGGLIYEYEGMQVLGCSGTVISSTTFVTAAHCYPDEVFRLVGVTFDDAFVPGESGIIPLDNSAFVPYSGYDGTAYTDIAVVALPYDPGVGYAELPEVGLLDTMDPSAQPGNQARHLTAVGYGTTGLNRGSGGPPQFEYPDVKMKAENRIIGLNSANTAGTLVHTTAAPGTGGGTCYGDSGGPFFVSGTNILVAITITGFNRNCGGGDLSLRTDLEWVQEFLT